MTNETAITEQPEVFPVSDQELRGRLDHHDQMLHDILILLTPISKIVQELAPLARRYTAASTRAGTVAAHLRRGGKAAGNGA